MKDNLQFRVSAELKNILGRDLITSPDIAIYKVVSGQILKVDRCFFLTFFAPIYNN